MDQPLPEPPLRRPVSVLVAAAVVALEGLGMVALAVVELASLDPDRTAVAVTTALFFAAIGVGLVWCGRALRELDSWARGPVVAVQLIGLLTASSFWGGDTTLIAVVLGAVCLVALIAVLHPATTAALASEELDGQDTP